MALWTLANLATPPEVFLDATDPSTFVLNGYGVLNWADKGTDGLDAYQTDTDMQPQLIPDVLNGHPVVRFSGGNPTGGGKRLQFSQTRNLMDKTFVFVWTGGGTLSGDNDSTRTLVAGAPGLFSYYKPWVGDAAQIYAYRTKQATYGIAYVSAREILNFYVDGRPSEPNLVRKDPYSAGYPYSTLGGSRAYETFNGDLAAFIVLGSDPSDEDRQRIEGYLAHRLGITSILEPGHPYYNTPPITEIVVPVRIPNAPDGARYRIWNSTRNAEIENDVVSGGSGIDTTFIADDDSVPHVEGDSIIIDVTYPVSGTAYLPSRVFGQVTASGVSSFVAQIDDEVYNYHGIDGSSVTKFEADFEEDDIQLVVQANFVGAEAYAYYVHTLTFESGIREWLNAVTAIDVANFRINTNIIGLKFDNLTTHEVWQLDNVRIFRSDGERPVKTPTTGGGGVDVNWREKVYIVNVGGSTLTAQESAKLLGLPDATTNAAAVMNSTVEGTVTVAQAQRLLLAQAAGNATGLETGEGVTFKSLDGTKTRIAGNVSSGVRNIILVDGT